jgi:hypothetical protein
MSYAKPRSGSTRGAIDAKRSCKQPAKAGCFFADIETVLPLAAAAIDPWPIRTRACTISNVANQRGDTRSGNVDAKRPALRDGRSFFAEQVQKKENRCLAEFAVNH